MIVNEFNIDVFELIHHNQNRIGIRFIENNQLLNKIRGIKGARWSYSLKIWHIPNSKCNRIAFGLEKQINTAKKIEIEKFKSWLLMKRYSTNTIKTYTESLHVFFLFFNELNLKDLDNQNIHVFISEYILKNKLSASYQNQLINAIKLYFQFNSNSKIEIQKLERPRKPLTLPNILSMEEVKTLLNAHRNIKHKAMLSLIYSCGLRRGELLNLKPTNIDSKRNIVIIKSGKGAKDRIVPLSPKILELLRAYYKLYKPKIWLFEGAQIGEPYDARSLSNVLKQAVQKSGIHKPVSLHWLRHSYATHLLEKGVSLRIIQAILGHKSSRTTEIYTHVSTTSIQKIISPFDEL